jgi:glycerol-3-phosphate dehydrogenase (NAD(P)+)
MALACSVLGGGAFGTALGAQLARRGHDVLLWDRSPERCEGVNREHRNPTYLAEVPLPANLRATPDLVEAARHADLLVPVVPSHALREVATAVRDELRPGTLVCCGTKGIEEGTLATVAELLREVMPPDVPVTVLSGPSFAAEVVVGLPTTVVVAGEDAPAAVAAEAFHGGTFRVYHTHDVVGVCLGGSLKNVMAVACGISDGLGLGHNTRAAIITRGLAEITRLATAAGAEPLTMMGLAGLGDLVLTCTGDLSRNRRLGLGLGKGQGVQDTLAALGGVAEGFVTSRTAHALGRRLGVEMPITEQVFRVLHEGKAPPAALGDLLGRDRKAEQG